MKTIQRFLPKLYPYLILIPLFGVVFFLQGTYDKAANSSALLDVKTEKHVLPASILKYISFGFNNVLADYYWVSIIQDFAGWDRTETFLLDEYKNLITMDPKFAYPYLFGILTVPSKAEPDSINLIVPIAESGMTSLPYNWEIPFYLGTQYQVIKNFERAYYYVEKAASLPITPTIVTNVYNSYKKRALTQDSATRSLIQAIYETTDSETTREIIRDSIILDDVKYVLSRIIVDYKIRFETYPSSLDTIIDAGMLQIDEALRERLVVTISPKNGALTVELLPLAK